MSESLELIDNEKMRNALMVDNVSNDDYAKLLVEQYRVSESSLDEAVRFVDSGIDNFIFWSGALMKMGLTMGTIENMMHIVAEANLTKSGGTTKDGKNVKGSQFTPPDEELREQLQLLPQYKEMK